VGKVVGGNGLDKVVGGNGLDPTGYGIPDGPKGGRGANTGVTLGGTAEEGDPATWAKTVAVEPKCVSNTIASDLRKTARIRRIVVSKEQKTVRKA
jgi:hypothetical protein